MDEVLTYYRRLATELYLCNALLIYIEKHRRPPTLIRLAPDLWEWLIKSDPSFDPVVKKFSFFKIKVLEDEEVKKGELELDSLN